MSKVTISTKIPDGKGGMTNEINLPEVLKVKHLRKIPPEFLRIYRSTENMSEEEREETISNIKFDLVAGAFGAIAELSDDQLGELTPDDFVEVASALVPLLEGSENGETNGTE